jgi:hypothetical protein
MRTLGSKFRLLASGVLAVGLLSLHAGGAEADLYYGPYLQPGGDPINVLFDMNGTQYNTWNHISRYMGWGNNGGGDQTFYDHGSPEIQWSQLASANVWSNRDHGRMNQGNDWGGSAWGTWTMAPVHYEENVWGWDCGGGHAVRSFDGTRNHVRGTFANNGFATGTYWKGHASWTPQCDGTSVWNDDYVAWIDIY